MAMAVITMLINDNNQLKQNVEQIGFQLALKTSKSLSRSDRLGQTECCYVLSSVISVADCMKQCRR